MYCEACGARLSLVGSRSHGVSETARVAAFREAAPPGTVQAIYVLCGTDGCMARACAEAGPNLVSDTFWLGFFTGARSTRALVAMLGWWPYAPKALERLLRLALVAEEAPIDRRRFPLDTPHIENERSRAATRAEKLLLERANTERRRGKESALEELLTENLEVERERAERERPPGPPKLRLVKPGDTK